MRDSIEISVITGKEVSWRNRSNVCVFCGSSTTGHSPSCYLQQYPEIIKAERESATCVRCGLILYKSFYCSRCGKKTQHRKDIEWGRRWWQNSDGYASRLYPKIIYNYPNKLLIEIKQFLGNWKEK